MIKISGYKGDINETHHSCNRSLIPKCSLAILPWRTGTCIVQNGSKNIQLNDIYDISGYDRRNVSNSFDVQYIKIKEVVFSKMSLKYDLFFSKFKHIPPTDWE